MAKKGSVNIKSIDFYSFASELFKSRNNEAAAILMLKLFLMFGDLEKVLGVKKIERHRFEFSVCGGRIDLLLFHKDKGISIVEVKAQNDVRTILAGIGQLCLYEVGIRKKMVRRPPKYINRILTAPIEPSVSLHIMEACEIAGVRFAHLPIYKLFSAEVNELYKWVESHL